MLNAMLRACLRQLDEGFRLGDLGTLYLILLPPVGLQLSTHIMHSHKCPRLPEQVQARGLEFRALAHSLAQVEVAVESREVQRRDTLPCWSWMSHAS